MLNNLLKDFKKQANPEKAKLLQRFFKTGKGEYGEGDIFLGLMVPEQRALAKKYPNLSLNEIQELLNSKIHEHRLTALFILIAQYKKSDFDGKRKIYKFYLKNAKRVNNWDLVDLSSHKIVGSYLLDKSEKEIADVLFNLARSTNLWERRISIISTFAFIPNNQFNFTLKLAEILLKDKHDLMHKAVGWALRELGKRDLKSLEGFLDKHIKEMPRTMLRYSIEKFSKEKKEYYMKK